MSILKMYCRVALVFMMAMMPLESAESELLQAKDVNKIMQQIFEQHVDKKEMTASILKNSFKVYIDQFDPNRVYLLDHETRPFLQMNDAEVARIMDHYQHSQFSEFKDLNNIIQKAIFRAREIRSALSKDPRPLYDKSASYSSDGYEDWATPI